MLFALFVVLLVVPVVELIVIVQMAGVIGVLPTVLSLVLISAAGAWLVKREGLGAIRRVQNQIARAEIPTDGLVDGLLVLLAGAMLVFPGFVTDTFGLILLVPPVRSLVRRVVIKRFRARVAGRPVGRIYDVRTVEFVESTYDAAPGRPSERPYELGR